MKKLLPIDQNNIYIDTFWYWADQFVVVNDIDKHKAWLINNFINLKSDKMWNYPMAITFDDGYEDKMSQFMDCPFIDTYKIQNENISGLEIIDLIFKSINQGMFVLVMIERSLIKSYKVNGQRNIHEVLVYGYDDNTKDIFFCDNTLKGKFSCDLTASFVEFSSAFETALGNIIMNSIYLLKPKRNESYTIDIYKVKRKLLNYLMPNNYIKDRWIFGIDILDDLANYFHKIQFDNFNCDIRGIYAIYDHKRSMSIRLDGISKLLHINAQIYEKYKEAEVISRKNILLYMKFYLQKNMKELRKIGDNLLIIKNIEQDILTKVIESIE